MRATPAEAAWSLTEAANEPFFTLVQRYVFPPFFVGTLAAGFPGGGAAAWGYATAAAGLLVAFGAPVLGAIADAGGRRRPYLLAIAAAAMLASALLWFAAPGRPLLLIAALAVLALVAVELLPVVTNAWLPDVAGPGRIGVLSGLAFAFGQLAGIAVLLLVLFLSETPPAWLAAIPHGVDRLAGPMAAVGVLLFLTPGLLLFRDPPGPRPAGGVAAGLATLRQMLAEAWHDRRLRLFYLGRAIGGDGLALVFAFGAVLAGESFGWKAGTLATFGIIVTVASAAGGFAGAAIDRRIGARRSIIAGFAAVLLGTLGVLAVDGAHILGAPTGVPLGEPFAAPQERAFMLAALLIAAGAGPAIAGMRALMAEIAPPGRVTAAFGLYSFVGKATNFAGPLLLGLVVSATGSLRLGLGVAILFLLVGIALFALMGALQPDRVAAANTRRPA